MATRTGTIIDRRNWNSDQCWYQQGMAVCWWDSHIKMWTCYRIDAENNQTTCAHYYGNAEQVIANQDYISKFGSVGYVIENWERP